MEAQFNQRKPKLKGKWKYPGTYGLRCGGHPLNSRERALQKSYLSFRKARINNLKVLDKCLIKIAALTENNRQLSISLQSAKEEIYILKNRIIKSNFDTIPLSQKIRILEQKNRKLESLEMNANTINAARENFKRGLDMLNEMMASYTSGATNEIESNFWNRDVNTESLARVKNPNNDQPQERNGSVLARYLTRNRDDSIQGAETSMPIRNSFQFRRTRRLNSNLFLMANVNMETDETSEAQLKVNTNIPSPGKENNSNNNSSVISSQHSPLILSQEKCTVQAQEEDQLKDDEEDDETDDNINEEKEEGKEEDEKEEHEVEEKEEDDVQCEENCTLISETEYMKRLSAIIEELERTDNFSHITGLTTYEDENASYFTSHLEKTLTNKSMEKVLKDSSNLVRNDVSISEKSEVNKSQDLFATQRQIKCDEPSVNTLASVLPSPVVKPCSRGITLRRGRVNDESIFRRISTPKKKACLEYLAKRNVLTESSANCNSSNNNKQQQQQQSSGLQMLQDLKIERISPLIPDENLIPFDMSLGSPKSKIQPSDPQSSFCSNASYCSSNYFTENGSATDEVNSNEGRTSGRRRNMPKVSYKEKSINCKMRGVGPPNKSSKIKGKVKKVK